MALVLRRTGDRGPLARFRGVALALTALAPTFLLVSETDAYDGFRCHDTGRLIRKGDARYLVVKKCREPDSISERREERRIRGGVVSGSRFGSEERVVEVIYEDWLYDFGKNRLVVHATFEQDRLIGIQFGDYGEK